METEIVSTNVIPFPSRVDREVEEYVRGVCPGMKWPPEQLEFLRRMARRWVESERKRKLEAETAR